MTCIDDKNGCKGLGRSAVGYWGRSVFRRLRSEQIINKERALLQDQLSTGIRTNLWIGVNSGNICNCYKKSNTQADRKCKTCHGVINGYVPGYLKFGYETFWMSPVDSDVTLVNAEVVNDFKSSKVALAEGALEGYIESGDKIFSRVVFGSFWEYDVASYLMYEDNSSVVLEFSLDSGSNWFDISELSVLNPVSGTIRFRATLLRDNEDILSPYFEIVRARYSKVPLRVESNNGSYLFGPWILILNSKPFKNYLKSEYGDYPSIDGMSFWTSGLSYFDPNIVAGSKEELLEGPNIIFELIDGALSGTRYLCTSWQNSDPLGQVIMTQTFSMRRVDPSDPFSLVW